MLLLPLSICFVLATVSLSDDAPRNKPYRDMEVRFKVKCQIPSVESTTFNVSLIEANRGRDAWFNPDRVLESKPKAKFGEVIYLKGMMAPELDRVLEPYLMITHKCDMRGRVREGCKTLPVHDNWPDVFPPPYYRDVGHFEVEELEKCSH